MGTRLPFVTGEWYHCYNRGVEKRVVFEDKSDYERFIALLYVCNGNKSIKIADRHTKDLQSILLDESVEHGEQLVDIGAYSLMPNHMHLVMRQKKDGGIALFMQKVFTGYTMYFNIKRKRTGALFSGTFKSKHIFDDVYLKQVVPYVLLNPVELFQPKWKEGVGDTKKAAKQVRDYRYSNLTDFLGTLRPETKITASLSEYYDSKPSLGDLLQTAQEYYQQQPPKV